MQNQVEARVAVEGLFDSARKCLSQAPFSEGVGRGRTFEIEGQSYDLTVASSRQEREEAYRLVHRVYKAEGFTDPGSDGIWYSIHNALPSTVTFVVRDESGEAIAAGTAVPDSPFGLPMERMYGPEIAAMRKAGRRMCEINSLVSTVTGEGWRGRMIILKVFSAALAYIRDVLNYDDLVCVASPKHARFYGHVLMLDTIGGLRADPHANGAESIALRLDIANVAARFREKYAHRPSTRNLHSFFWPSVDDAVPFRAWLVDSVTPLDVETFAYFFLERVNLVSELQQDQIEYLRRAYPEFPVWQADVALAGQLGFAVA